MKPAIKLITAALALSMPMAAFAGAKCSQLERSLQGEYAATMTQSGEQNIDYLVEFRKIAPGRFEMHSQKDGVLNTTDVVTLVEETNRRGTKVCRLASENVEDVRNHLIAGPLSTDLRGRVLELELFNKEGITIYLTPVRR